MDLAVVDAARGHREFIQWLRNLYIEVDQNSRRTEATRTSLIGEQKDKAQR